MESEIKQLKNSLTKNREAYKAEKDIWDAVLNSKQNCINIMKNEYEEKVAKLHHEYSLRYEKIQIENENLKKKYIEEKNQSKEIISKLEDLYKKETEKEELKNDLNTKNAGKSKIEHKEGEANLSSNFPVSANKKNKKK